MKRKECGCPIPRTDSTKFEACNAAGHQTVFVGGSQWICDCQTFVTCWHDGGKTGPGDLTRRGEIISMPPTERELIEMFGEIG